MQAKHISDFSELVEPYGGRYVLTTDGTLVGGLGLSGFDPDGLSPADKVGLAELSAVITGALPPRIATVHAFIHHDDALLALRSRARPLSDYLSRIRTEALNQRGLTDEALITYLEARPRTPPGRIFSWRTVEHLALAPFERRSCRALSALFSFDSALRIELAELSRQCADLDTALSSLRQHWSGLMGAWTLNLHGLWAHARFLATLDPSVLDLALEEPIPDQDLGNVIAGGDIKPRLVGDETFIKLGGPQHRYARVAAVKSISDRPIHGIFSELPSDGSYLIVSRFTPYTDTELWLRFWHKRKDLARKAIKWSQLLFSSDYDVDQDQLRPVLKRKFDELERAEAAKTVWGSWHCYVVAFGTASKKILETCRTLDATLTTRGLALAWQDVDALECFAACQPGGGHKSLFDFSVALDVAAEASPLFVSHPGLPQVEHLNGEEAQYAFETRSRRPLHYSPYAEGGRGFIAGVGPTTKGKSFLKNTLAAHFLKYGGLLRTIDIDRGAETLAATFGDEAGVLKLGEGGQGFNVFAACTGVDDLAFRDHLRQLLTMLIELNDVTELQQFTATDQDHLNRAIDKTLRNHSRESWHLPLLIAEMPETLARKFRRWVTGDGVPAGGEYSGLFDCAIDAIGDVTKALGVLNLLALKESRALDAVLFETVYRTMTAFKDESLLGLPKWIDIDEARWLLSRPGGGKLIEAEFLGARKFNYGLSLWTQSPLHYLEASGWDGIRTAVTTFMCLADPQMDADLYREAFHLTPGECETIKRLIPQREVFIKQPHIGLSKVAILQPEPAAYVVATSSPGEVIYRNARLPELMAMLGIEQALETVYHELQERSAHARTRRQGAA